MSFDEPQHMDEDEINLAELLRSIWFNKFSLLTFIVVSALISIMYSTSLEPTYKAETVFEKPINKPVQDNVALLNNVGSSGFFNLLTSGSAFGGDSFFSEIRSESFLKTVILNNAQLDSQMLKKFCPLPSREIPLFSLRSLLISLGLSENRSPSKSQKISLLVKCINNMLEINFDTYGSDKSSAYRLSIESGDPDFSANLANQIVKKYFVRHEARKDEDFKSVKRYLSKVIAEAQLDFIEASKLKQQFLIKHTLLMNLKLPNAKNVTGSEVSALTAPSPFASELNKEIANLSQLEKSLSQLKQASSNLLSFKELDQEKVKSFISSTEVQGVLSRTFITAISKINNLSATTNVINQEIKKIVSQELMSLSQQIQALEEKIGKREEQTVKLMNIENRYQGLAIDVGKKLLIFEGLKDELKEKILSAGLANIDQPVLLTKAVPPFSKASPNKKLVVALGVVFSIFLGISYILIRQMSLKRVYSLSQLQKISKRLSCYAINYKQLKKMSERPDQIAFDQSFFSNAMGMGKFGCIIDLSQKRLNNSLASEFSKTIVNLLATDNSKIACLDTSLSKKPFYAGAQKNFASDPSARDSQGSSSIGTLTFINEDGMISSGEISKIKKKYLDYDKIICTLGTEIGDLTKYKFIEQCDFYILIGRSFHFDEFTFKKFLNFVGEKEKKCLGCFLID